ncbi:MAK10-like protein [Tanacetum coccineum]
MEDLGLFTLPCIFGDSKPFDTLADLGSYLNIIPLYLFKKLNIRLLEETDHIFGLADGTQSYPVGIVKYIEVQIGKLKLLNDFYVIDMKKDPDVLSYREWGGMLYIEEFQATSRIPCMFPKRKFTTKTECQNAVINAILDDVD